jgi:hypothetical protein
MKCRLVPGVDQSGVGGDEMRNLQNLNEAAECAADLIDQANGTRTVDCGETTRCKASVREVVREEFTFASITGRLFVGRGRGSTKPNVLPMVK